MRSLGRCKGTIQESYNGLMLGVTCETGLCKQARTTDRPCIGQFKRFLKEQGWQEDTEDTEDDLPSFWLCPECAKLLENNDGDGDDS